MLSKAVEPTKKNHYNICPNNSNKFDQKIKLETIIEDEEKRKQQTLPAHVIIQIDMPELDPKFITFIFVRFYMLHITFYAHAHAHALHMRHIIVHIELFPHSNFWKA